MNWSWISVPSRGSDSGPESQTADWGSVHEDALQSLYDAQRHESRRGIAWRKLTRESLEEAKRGIERLIELTEAA